MADHLAAPLPLPEAFAAAGTDLLELVNAAEAVVRWSNSVVRLDASHRPPPSTSPLPNCNPRPAAT